MESTWKSSFSGRLKTTWLEVAFCAFSFPIRSPHTMNFRPLTSALLAIILLLAGAESARAQEEAQKSAQEAAQESAQAQDADRTHQESLPEVRQLVTMQFQSGKTGEALSIFKEQALPLYEANEAMLFFRGFLEIESPEPLDLIVVSAFRGMAGMDASNDALRAAGNSPETSIGAIYSRIGALAVGHHDQFVEMIAGLENADPMDSRLVALVSYQLIPGGERAFEQILKMSLLPWEKAAGVPSATGRFLISDGWQYLRFIGFESLGDFHDYWTRLRAEPRFAAIEKITVRRKEIIVAPSRPLSVR